MEAVDDIGEAREKARTARSRRSGRVTTIVVCLFVAGFVLPVAGLFLVVVHALVPGDVILGRIGTIAMIASIPTLLAASHLMDLIERKTK